MYQRQNNPIYVKKKSKIHDQLSTDPRFRKVVTVPQEKTQLKSQSEFSLPARSPGTVVKCMSPNSTPVIQAKKTLHIEQGDEPVVNKYTMTKQDDVIDGLTINPRTRSRSQSKTRCKSREFKKLADPRLCEKYSVLRVPWQRSWTLPAFAVKPSLVGKDDLLDHSDRQTYLYDEGTEMDSLYLEDKQTNMCGKTLHKQCMLFLFFCGTICGILLVSFLIWFVFGNNFIGSFFKPRKVEEGRITRSFKFLGGGLIYVITRIFESLGYVLALPTQKVYQSEPEYYRWPINPVQLPN